MAQRRDYASNLRKKQPSGCTWCGAPVAPPVTTASYCSDVCLQMDMQGVDDRLPVMVLQPGNSGNSAYVARKFAAYNRDHG
ncbi:hypothetical protein [Streptomyces sp. NBC_00687]|uniref:hypothetical protein n=1 Tax=Streptomyces sp. NBC_00687 TaxID=2975807 RepID=UPI00224CCBE5|nr:hypothetical protein [Streptomyces sp. NBC_00687]MCX4912890.1 hypothetical protein [Streptomyces sp. NBC_00687]